MLSEQCQAMHGPHALHKVDCVAWRLVGRHLLLTAPLLNESPGRGANACVLRERAARSECASIACEPPSDAANPPGRALDSATPPLMANDSCPTRPGRG